MKYLLFTLPLSVIAFTAFAFRDTTNGFSAPADVSGNAHKLAWYLCDEVTGDTQKANLIYNWITHNIAFDIKANKDPNRPAPVVQKILAEKKATSDGYALLYMEMCKEVGLTAVTISGYAKGWTWDNGTAFYIPRHQWCAVMIDRRWELVDPTAGAGGVIRAPGWFRNQLNKLKKEEKIIFSKKEVFEFRYDPYYFMPPPAILRFSHLASDPLWQLMKTPMPLDVFEKGDTAIDIYNETYRERVNRGPELEYISRLNENQKRVECADREHKFNARFSAGLAASETIKAAELIAKHASRHHIPPRTRFEDAYRGMVLAQSYLKKQRSFMPDYYNELKKQNIAKNKLAGDRIRGIRTHNKSLVALCRTHKLSAERKLSALELKEEKAVMATERIVPERIDSIKTAAIERDRQSLYMKTLTDSISSKQARLKKLNFGLIDKMQAVTLLQDDNAYILTLLDSALNISDTALAIETEQRLNFKDDNDDEVRALMQLYNGVKSVFADSLQRQYARNFDSVVTRYEQLIQLYIQQADLYKTTLRDIEQYKRGSSAEIVSQWYANCCKGYTDCMSQYSQAMEVYRSQLSSNMGIFESKVKRYEDELVLTDRMEEAEAARKIAEEEALDEAKSFDERENDRQQLNAAEMLKTLTDILSK